MDGDHTAVVLYYSEVNLQEVLIACQGYFWSWVGN